MYIMHTSIMTKEFNTKDNKGFLWNLMYENGIFADIPSSKVNIVKKTFDELVLTIDTRSSALPLKEKNKQILLQMNAKRNMFLQSDMPVFVHEATDIRSQQFNIKLDEQKKDFAKNINTSKPKDIDFSDKYDGPIGNEMDNLVAAAIAKRENELNVVLQDQDPKTGGQWINKDNPPNIKIGETTELIDKAVEEIESKRVTFGKNEIREYETRDDTSDFLSMLKPAEQKTDMDIDARLKIIEENQTRIINMLIKILQSVKSK